MGEGDYEFTKPPAPGEARAGPGGPTGPGKAKAANPNKCSRCRTGTLVDKKTGAPCCPKMVRLCKDCGETFPK